MYVWLIRYGQESMNFFLMEPEERCVFFGLVTYPPIHPFDNENIKVKEQWGMQ